MAVFKKRPVQNVTLVALGLVLAVLTVEVFFRLTPTFLPKPVQAVVLESQIPREPGYFYDKYVGRLLEPNVNRELQTLDSILFTQRSVSLGFEGVGFRDDGVSGKSPYAVVLGDSFLEGYGVNLEEVAVELMEQESGLDFANLATSFTASVQHVRVLERFGIPLRPRVVLWAFSPNDLIGSWAEASPRRGPFAAGIRDFLSQHLRTYELVKFVLRTKTYAPSEENAAPVVDVINYEQRGLNFEFWTEMARKFHDVSDPRAQRGWEVTRDSLRRARELAKSIGADFIVILVPTREIVYWHIVKELVVEPEKWDLEGPLRLVRQFCTEEGFHCLDLTPAFIERAKENEQLYFRRDSHWNVRGNELAAEVMLNYLLD